MGKPDITTVEVPTWVKRGSMLVRRDALDPEDPESVYNYIAKTYPGVDPVDFGATPPRGRCDKCGSYVDSHESNEGKSG